MHVVGICLNEVMAILMNTPQNMFWLENWRKLSFYYYQNLSRLMTKLTKWHMPPAKTQISLGIHPVWSESSLSASTKLGSLPSHWVHSRLWSDWADAQADLSLLGHTDHFVGFVMRRPKYPPYLFLCPALMHSTKLPSPAALCNKQSFKCVWAATKYSKRCKSFSGTDKEGIRWKLKDNFL